MHTRFLFNLGQVVATPQALDLAQRTNIDPLQLLQRHHTGDWGDLDASDKETNQQALTNGLRILSSYQCGDEKIWIITEGDRSATTILTPSDY